MITQDSQRVKQLLYLAVVEMDHINTGVVTGQLDKGKGKKRWCNEQVLKCLRTHPRTPMCPCAIPAMCKEMDPVSCIERVAHVAPD